MPETTKAPKWAWWIATGFGSGLLRPAPGTWGSLAALLAWLLFEAVLVTPFTTWAQGHGKAPHFVACGLGMEALQLLVVAGITWLAVLASDRVVDETGQKDPGFIVADEWAGMWIALWPLRWIVAHDLYRLFMHGWWRMALLVLLPFALFRLFDIWKPWPIRQIQVLPRGQGVVADDVVAGLYALPLVVLLQPILAAWLRIGS